MHNSVILYKILFKSSLIKCDKIENTKGTDNFKFDRKLEKCSGIIYIFLWKLVLWKIQLPSNDGHFLICKIWVLNHCHYVALWSAFSPSAELPHFLCKTPTPLGDSVVSGVLISKTKIQENKYCLFKCVCVSCIPSLALPLGPLLSV